MGENCRTGCRTRQCEKYAECLRSAHIQVGPVWTNSKTIHKEMGDYAAARAEGIQPAGTQPHQVKAAVEASQRAGKAWDASTESFKG